MNILKQWILILFVYFLGEVAAKSLSLPIPGNIMGMIFLFLFLVTGIIKLEKIEDAAKSILGNLAFLFIPAGVGLMNYFGIISNYVAQILFIVVITTFIVMSCTGLTVQLVSRKIKSSAVKKIKNKESTVSLERGE
ncbi:CidA/LrgA family protein [Clostridium sp.]|uniref:CidA/LrgA family protein n=1 Tax=Clostridium sp. TaxID=1506 RepID=UPI00261615FC|nr:CidA/LrgA family protein [Clostridium sp.]